MLDEAACLRLTAASLSCPCSVSPIAGQEGVHFHEGGKILNSDTTRQCGVSWKTVVPEMILDYFRLVFKFQYTLHGSRASVCLEESHLYRLQPLPFVSAIFCSDRQNILGFRP
ncbi:hypothetical protein E2C01_096521 [Portunus trituberculatus]|uniref:Uncharacterized protein n=1 Tax=Portunus trituberculatus TaxID=210409 RepID=A0A5B7JVU5_PORTR|nr:hypothetical protein [Portunus trituberculatus]